MSKNKTTIMYTDVVGYSKLTGDNQQVALIILDEHNKILKKNTQKFSGDIVKLTGDGLCALFNNPEDGIKCSIEIQKSLKKRNKLSVEERKIQIRIGLHYGTYELKDNDVFGDGVNLAKKIEPVAPHSGIAISEDLNKMIWDTNDIYLRKYTKLEFNNKFIQLFEVYLDLISWCINKKKQDLQVVDSTKIYNKAHSLFHSGDYSSAIKFAFLAMNNSNEINRADIFSFICHTFICLGDIKYANNILEKIELEFSQNAHSEQIAHLYKMKGNLEFNIGKKDKALVFFEKSFNLMLESNKKYINEIIYSLSLILLEKKKYDVVAKYLDQSDSNDDYYNVILYGIEILSSNQIDNNKTNVFIDKIKKIDNQHLSSLAYRIAAKIFLKVKDFDKAKDTIIQSKDLIIKSSKNISDKSQRENFLNNILIHKDIMELSDKISDHFLDLTFKKVQQSESESRNTLEVYNFCRKCGTKNENNYNFCINCGNNLQIKGA